MGKSEKDIKKICGNANVTKGLSIKGSKAEESGDSVRKWLNKNGLI